MDTKNDHYPTCMWFKKNARMGPDVCNCKIMKQYELFNIKINKYANSLYNNNLKMNDHCSSCAWSEKKAFMGPEVCNCPKK